MESAKSGGEAKASSFVSVTPDQLRYLANAMESFVKNCDVSKGQSVTIPLSEFITLYWEPDGKPVSVPYKATFENSVR